MTATVLKPCTAEEYLAREVQSDTRHEYRNGEIVAMTGGTPAHNKISDSFFFLLKASLRKIADLYEAVEFEPKPTDDESAE